MKKASWLVPLALLAAAAGGGPQAATPRPAPGGGITVSVHTDKTALWVGDVLRYTVRALHASDVEFVTDNLTAEQLRLTPFTVRAVAWRRAAWNDPAGPGRGVLEITLLLSTLETGNAELTIPPLNLYYLRRAPGVRRQESAVEVLRTAPVTVGLRSTLTPQAWSPRDAKPVPQARAWGPAAALALGLAGLGFLLWRLGRWAWRQWRNPQPSSRARREQRERLAQALLDELRALGSADPPALYAAVAAHVRVYLKHAFDIEAPALTSTEIDAALAAAAAPAAFRRDLRAILEQCDQMRYGRRAPGEFKPNAQLLADAEALLRPAALGTAS